MIIDCFTFFNELDLLEIRLNELGDTVDKFVIVEAELTQSLIPKPLYFEENKRRYEKFLDKIVHIKMTKDLCPDNGNNLWNMENMQRNQISRGIHLCGPEDNTIILISDLDEIPRAKMVQELPNIFAKMEYKIVSFEMDFLAYFLNLRAKNRKWIGTVAYQYSAFPRISPQEFRFAKDNLPLINNSGWHFSWLGGYKKIYEKTQSCIEPFDKSKLPTLDQFKEHFEKFTQSQNKFFIHLENLSKQETEFSKTEIDDSFPQYLLSNLEKYKEFILC